MAVWHGAPRLVAESSIGVPTRSRALSCRLAGGVPRELDEAARRHRKTRVRMSDCLGKDRKLHELLGEMASESFSEPA